MDNEFQLKVFLIMLFTIQTPHAMVVQPNCVAGKAWISNYTFNIQIYFLLWKETLGRCGVERMGHTVKRKLSQSRVPVMEGKHEWVDWDGNRLIHRHSNVSVQTAYKNMSTVSHKPLLISNDWMEIMLYGCALLKIAYLGMFSMKVCFCKLFLCITNDQSKHRY